MKEMMTKSPKEACGPHSMFPAKEKVPERVIKEGVEKTAMGNVSLGMKHPLKK